MTNYALVSIFYPARQGLAAAITGRLFDLGINLGDRSFWSSARAQVHIGLRNAGGHNLR
jgi:hypothetical protein